VGRLVPAEVTASWINGVLIAIGAPRTRANRMFMYGWWQWEGGNGGPHGRVRPSAKFNWLNTTRPMWRSTDFNAIGVQNYRTWLQGVRATAKTLKNGRYPDVLAALRSGDPFMRQPLDGLSIWVSGRPASGNQAGLNYALRVVATGYEWKL
jgi:outer membrane biogenesis lipoprotein LolB